MLLAVISDSHLGAPSPWLESVYARHLARADALLHCGDITGRATWSFFLQHPNFHACLGNCDWDLGAELSPVVRFDLGDLSVAAMHGFGNRSGVGARAAEALGPHAGLVCFGHTHQRHFSTHAGFHLLNPGSLGEGSLALVRIEPGQALDCTFVDVELD
ncbi:MAG TPA: YfcE family phosphodiesterase [Desulfovibrio sp.]|nr:YfcE family phosphodiesterase [Desulfovibrio sp.]